MADAELMKQLRELQERVVSLTSSGTQVNEVRVKLPIFWSDKPGLWFAQAEAQFDIHGIKADSTKFGYVLSMLDTTVAAEVEDAISNPPPEGKYEHLKRELINKLSLSRAQQIRQLLSDEELGDRKPSAFLRHLRSLAGTEMGDDSILRELWMRRLPREVQRILIAQKDLKLDKVAEIADAIAETSSAPTAVHAASSSTVDLNHILQRIEDLTKKVEALSVDRGRSRSATHSRPTSRSSSRSGSRWCWYHKRFRQNATKCNSPCSWKPKQEGNQPSNQ